MITATDEIFELCLVITEKCNLNCSYCNLSKKSSKIMPFATAKNRIDEMFGVDHSFSAYTITFMGGEPFVAFEVIRDIVQYIKDNYAGHKTYYKIVTNGTLVHEAIQEWIVQNKANVQIILSLDGSKEVHNRNRSNSYDSIDIDFFKNYTSQQNINAVFSTFTLNEMADSIIELEKEGFFVKSFIADSIDWKKDDIARLGKQLYKLINYYCLNNIKPTTILSMALHYIEGDMPVGCGFHQYSYTISCDDHRYDCHRCSPFENVPPLVIPIDYIEDLSKAKLLDPKCAGCVVSDICNVCPAANASKVDLPELSSIWCRLKKVIYIANAYFYVQLFTKYPNHIALVNYTKKMKEETITAAKKILSSIDCNVPF